MKHVTILLAVLFGWAAMMVSIASAYAGDAAGATISLLAAVASVVYAAVTGRREVIARRRSAATRAAVGRAVASVNEFADRWEKKAAGKRRAQK